MIEVAGRDATSAYEDVGHSEDAREIMHPYLVGVIEGGSEKRVASKPAVKIVRRGPSKTAAAKSNLTRSIEFTIAGVGGVALLVITWAAGITLLPSANLTSHYLQGGFTSGFLSASVVAAGFGYLAYHRMTQAMTFGGEYTRFPAHMHASNVVHSTNRPAGVLIAQVSQQPSCIRAAGVH